MTMGEVSNSGHGMMHSYSGRLFGERGIAHDTQELYRFKIKNTDSYMQEGFHLHLFLNMLGRL